MDVAPSARLVEVSPSRADALYFCQRIIRERPKRVAIRSPCTGSEVKPCALCLACAPPAVRMRATHPCFPFSPAVLAVFACLGARSRALCPPRPGMHGCRCRRLVQAMCLARSTCARAGRAGSGLWSTRARSFRAPSWRSRSCSIRCAEGKAAASYSSFFGEGGGLFSGWQISLTTTSDAFFG
eukprot:6173721-Pleurochrysis_carterae.AAC.1